MSERKYFGKLREGAEPPNLIEVQLDSYVEFLQQDITPGKRKMTGLQAVFKEVFPIQSYDEKLLSTLPATKSANRSSASVRPCARA